MGERGTSTATIMFTDVVGSTELRARLGETAADKLFVEHQRQLGQVVSRHGGRVVKFGGDGVMASFGSASEAVNAAVALQEHVSQATPQLSVRVGVAAGDVSWEEDDCFGLPVATAARLQATAGGGEILVSHIVRLLAGDRAGDRYEHAGVFDLKGVPDPVDAYAVGWTRPSTPTGSPALDSPPPVPLALAGGSTHRLVGRDDALTVVRQAWDAAQQGPGRVLLVGGEAGAGKTRLAAEIAAELHADGACVLFGGCDSDLALPYQPWVQAIDHLLAALPRSGWSSELAGVLAPLANLLSHVEWLGVDARRITLDAGAERYRTYGAFAAMFREGADRWPTLVVLDDLHWAGPQTLALLRHVVRSGLPAGVLVVGTFRDTSDEITEPLAGCLADLRRVDAASRLRLGGLDSVAIEHFVADAVGQPLDDSLRRLAGQLTERSGGNAFYLGELWRHLVDVGAVTLDRHGWAVNDRSADRVIPESIREVVSDRLAHLSPPARRIVDLAALSGQRIDLQVLEVAGELSADDLDRAVDEVVAAGVLTAVAGTALVYRFAHALVRDTVEASIAPHVRAKVHLALAQAIESVHEADRRPVLADLARHYSSAGGPLDKLTYYGRRAASQALRAAAYDEAVAHLDMVLDHTPPSVERSLALVELGKVHLRRGAFDASRSACAEAFGIATDLDDASAAAEAAMGFELAMHFPGLPGGPGVAMLRTALEMVGEEPTSRRAQLLASLGRALVFSGRASEGMQIAETAVSLARMIDDDEALSVALEALVTAIDDPMRELSAGRELAQLAERQNDPWAASYASSNLLRAFWALGQLDEAAEVLERHRATSAAGHFATFEFIVHAYDTVFALAAGDLAAAEAAAERARAKGAAYDAPYDAGVYGLQMYAIRRAQGRLDEVAPVMRALAATSDPPAIWRPGLAALYAELGMLDDARAVFDDLATDGFARVTRDAVWPASLTFLAETCIALADTEQARTLHGELTRFRGRNLMAGMTICLGPADRLLGSLAALLGRHDEADGHFRAALEMAQRCASPLWTAEVQYDWAVALAPRDPAGAHELGSQAITTAKLLGFGRLSSRSAPGEGTAATRSPAEAHAAVVTQSAEVGLPDDLSAREAEVLRLVAIGLSNREIGERLFISTNTVANHIRAILRKTCCANRTEASLYAVRHGLVDR